MDKFDIGIIGSGVAGTFAALRLMETNKDAKTILFDFGRPPGKRRRQLEGWFGCLPNGDGKFYVNHSDNLKSLIGENNLNIANDYVLNTLSNIEKLKITKDKLPSVDVQNKFKKIGFDIKLNDYIQWKSDKLQSLSKHVADRLEDLENLTFSFDNEVNSIVKNKNNEFVVRAADGDFICKKIILCVGRSGWRWVTNLYKNLGLSVNDSTASVGIKIEMSAQHMKSFNKSHCSFTNKDIEIGPFSWNGTVIPEDHADLVISSFRSNENRWKSDKVSFSLIKHLFIKENNGVYQADRLGKLAFLLSNDRVGKERVSSIYNNELLLIPEYNWIANAINDLSTVMPFIKNRGYFHMPDIQPMAARIPLGSNLESELDGLFVCGESAGFKGLMAAAISGVVAADSVQIK